MKMNNNTMAGVKPGNGFKEALMAPLEMKANIVNESRLEHGQRVIVLAKKAARNITLEFQIVGTSTSDFNTKLAAFLAQLYNGTVKLEPTEFTTEVFHLVYTGKSPVYSTGLSGKACKISVGFLEPDPSRRTSQ